MVERIAACRGLLSPDFRLTPRLEPETPSSRCIRHPLFDKAKHQDRAADFGALALPRTLSLYAVRMGGRFVGSPIYEARFRMCSIPILVSVEMQQPSLRFASLIKPKGPLAA